MAWGKFSLARESHIFSLKEWKLPFSQTLHFLGKQSIPRESESYFQGKMIPQRENFPSEGNFSQFSLGGKILPQKMFRGISWERNSCENFRWCGRRTQRKFGEMFFCRCSPFNFQEKWPQEIKKSSTFSTRDETKFFHREILGGGCPVSPYPLNLGGDNFTP